MANIEEKVENIILEPIKKLGYELYDVEYVKEGKDYFLRIYIQAEKGIDLNDCEKVSNEITEILDKEDPIKEQYFLEVSSTGVEKNLRKEKHLKENLNNNKHLIIIILYKWGKNMNVDKKRAAALFIILIMVLSGVASFMLLVL